MGEHPVGLAPARNEGCRWASGQRWLMSSLEIARAEVLESQAHQRPGPDGRSASPGCRDAVWGGQKAVKRVTNMAKIDLLLRLGLGIFLFPPSVLKALRFLLCLKRRSCNLSVFGTAKLSALPPLPSGTPPEEGNLLPFGQGPGHQSFSVARSR